MMTRVSGDREVVEYRWRHYDVHWRTSGYYTDEEAADTFKGRAHERIDDSQRIGRRAVIGD